MGEDSFRLQCGEERELLYMAKLCVQAQAFLVKTNSLHGEDKEITGKCKPRLLSIFSFQGGGFKGGRRSGSAP